MLDLATGHLRRSLIVRRAPLAGAAIALGLIGAKTAEATPYDTLASIAGSYNVFLLGNLGTASSAYGTDSIGSVAVAGNAYLNGASIDSGGSGAAALVVGGNLSQTNGSDTGNVFVGGNATVANTSSAITNLVVGGTLAAQSGQLGNVFVGGASANFAGGTTINGTVNLTAAHSSLTSGGSSPPAGIYVTPTTTTNVPGYWGTIHTSGGASTPSSPLDLYGSSTDIANASTSLSNLAATNLVSSGGLLTINLTQNGLNVVDLSLPNGATVTGINVVTAPGVSPTGLVLNVAGNNLNFNGGSFSLGSLNSSDVLFNFSSATALSLSSLAFQGALLAPLATVSFSNGQLDGSLIADNFVGSAEFHKVAFNDPLPAYATGGSGGGGGGSVATPEPGSIVLLGTGLIAFGLLRRRARGLSAVRMDR